VFPVVLALACGRSPAPADAPRWVSLAPQITETVAALGAADHLVGRSDWCASPPSVTALPAFGSALSPHLEALAAARATLVLVEAAPSARVAELSAIAPTEALPWLTLADLVASTRRLGELSGHPDEAARWIATYQAHLSVDPPATGPSVLLALAGEGLDRGEVWFLKRNSLHGAALHAAGARNAVDRDVSGLPVLPAEQVLALDPDAIVVLSPTPLDDAARARILAEWGRLSPLRAVREGKVVALGGPDLLSTGPAVADLAETLRGALAPLGVR
jgi:ABC-type Fe3+-hydroxamate transport system substrate-binding protein